MVYSAVTAFADMEPPVEELAKLMAQKWSSMAPEQLEAELLPMFRKLKVACNELKRTGRLHILNSDS